MPQIVFYEPGGDLDRALVTALAVTGWSEPARLDEWSHTEKLMVYDWCMRQHLMASDVRHVRQRQQPLLIALECKPLRE